MTTTTAERYRKYEGPALFSMGFRPFFLSAALWAALSVPIWIASYLGWLPSVTRDWHVHEMLFGYLASVIAGFLLTAVPNWTGRLPVAGASLAALFSLWAAGRVAMLAAPDSVFSSAIDSAFLFALAAIIAREVIAGRNVRNLPVCVLVLTLGVANVLTHLRPFSPELALIGERIGLGVVAMLVTLIGGRIIPSFTRNWMAKNAVKPEPAAADRFDVAVLLATGFALAAWIVAPASALAGASLAIAGAGGLARLARWRGWTTIGEPLVAILHVGYAWFGAALLLLAGAVFFPTLIPPSAGIHALTAGGFGVMTLAVMTRATRGHTGHALSADRATQAIYVLINLGAALRVASALVPAASALLLALAAIGWSGAFALFVLVYGPFLVRARRTASS